MTKTLTEQWREGKLPDGKYYIKLEPNFTERYDVGYSEGGDFVLYNIEDIEEVLAPVPDYMDCKRLMNDSIELDKAKIKIYELVSKTDKLEKKLKIAKKALKDIQVRSQRDWNEYDCMGCARKALYDIEMEGVK